MWKRALLFGFGVAQIVVGAFIFCGTEGALTNVSVSLLMEGAQSCLDAIFQTESLNELGKYLGKKTLSHIFSLTLAGTKGIKELATLSKSGFQIFKNSSFQ